ncbi:MAG: LptF/LptG family permease [Saprospiraceae bacterium]
MLSSFAGPFMVTFFIAIFVLMMQYLWVYVDDIVGKGAGLFMLVELLSYMTVSLVPMALPIAVLISSVMVLGNLAERYELSSMKSAGIPLFRVMMPLLLACFFIAGFSFFCSDSLIPVSNLKFKSRLYDIRKQRPALSIEQGVFNDDFQDIVIRVGKKEADNETVEDVLIYDQSSIADNRLTEVIAKEGKMYTTEDGKYFVMDLFDGNQYHELKPTFKDGKQNYPFVRTSFEEWTKVFDLGAFEIQRTDEELFKSHHNNAEYQAVG